MVNPPIHLLKYSQSRAMQQFVPSGRKELHYLSPGATGGVSKQWY